MESVLRAVDPAAEPKWDSWAASLPQASFFHSTAWCNVLRTAYGYRPSYFTSGQSASEGVSIPAMEVNSWITGRRGISLPFTDECSAAYSRREVYDRSFDEIRRYAKERRWDSFESRGSCPAVPEARASVSFRGHSLALSKNLAAQEHNLDSPTRRAVRKAEKSNLTIEVSTSLDATRQFYRLLCQTRKRHGLPPQPFRFFENIQRFVLSQNLGMIMLASVERTPVAAAIFFQYRDSATFKFGASDETYQQFRPNNLIMWRAIRWYAEQGFSRLDFGRTSLGNDGLRRFKLGWGAQERTIEYYKYDFRRSEFVTSSDQAHGWHNRVFRIMPQFAARLFGAVTYRHIA